MLLRRKARTVVAFGACAHLGGVVGLGNLSEPGELLDTAYRHQPTVSNPEQALRRASRVTAAGHDLTLPALLEPHAAAGRGGAGRLRHPRLPALAGDPRRRRGAAARRAGPAAAGARCWPPTPRSATAARATAPGPSGCSSRRWPASPPPSPTRPPASWPRGWSATGRPRGRAASPAASRSTCPAGAASGRSTAWPTAAPPCSPPSPRSSPATRPTQRRWPRASPIRPAPSGATAWPPRCCRARLPERPAVTSRRITIDPITRLEGHGKVEILLDEQGNAQHAFLQVPELRGFERFCVGRPAEEMPQLTAHVCGVCPAAHHLASVRALDALYGVAPPPAALALQRLYYDLFVFEDHLLHYWYMGGPDFLVGPSAPAPLRNILGVLARVGESLGRRILSVRKEARDLMAAISGRTVHPVFALPGGCSRPMPPEALARLREVAPRLVRFSVDTLASFRGAVLEQPRVPRRHPGARSTGSAPTRWGWWTRPGGSPSSTGRCGSIDTAGAEMAPLRAARLPRAPGRAGRALDLRQVHLPEGPGLDRLHRGRRERALPGRAAGPAQRGHAPWPRRWPRRSGSGSSRRWAGRPTRPWPSTGRGWSRRCRRPSGWRRRPTTRCSTRATSAPCRGRSPGRPRAWGWSRRRAARSSTTTGAAADGLLTAVNLVVASQHNAAPVQVSVRKAARGLIRNGVVDDGLLNQLEMAFRAYDPCNACASHSLPGELPLVVTVKDHRGAGGRGDAAAGARTTLSRREPAGPLPRQPAAARRRRGAPRGPPAWRPRRRRARP